MVLEKTFENPSDRKVIKPVNPRGNQAPMLWPPDAKSRLTGKALMLGKIEGKRRKGQQRMRWLDGITDSMDMSLQEALFQQAGMQSSQDAGKVIVLQGRRGSHPQMSQLFTSGGQSIRVSALTSVFAVNIQD